MTDTERYINEWHLPHEKCGSWISIAKMSTFRCSTQCITAKSFFEYISEGKWVATRIRVYRPHFYCYVNFRIEFYSKKKLFEFGLIWFLLSSFDLFLRVSLCDQIFVWNVLFPHTRHKLHATHFSFISLVKFRFFFLRRTESISG